MFGETSPTCRNEQKRSTCAFEELIKRGYWKAKLLIFLHMMHSNNTPIIVVPAEVIQYPFSLMLVKVVWIPRCLQSKSLCLIKSERGDVSSPSGWNLLRHIRNN